MATSSGVGPGSRATATITAIARPTTRTMTTPMITARSPRRRGRRHAVDLGGELEVPGGEAPGVVGAQRDLHALPPDVEIRMVVLRLGEEADAHHERDGGREVAAVERAHDLVTGPLPLRPIGQAGGHRVVVEAGPHRDEATGVPRRRSERAVRRR